MRELFSCKEVQKKPLRVHVDFANIGKNLQNRLIIDSFYSGFNIPNLCLIVLFCPVNRLFGGIENSKNNFGCNVNDVSFFNRMRLFLSLYEMAPQLICDFLNASRRCQSIAYSGFSHVGSSSTMRCASSLAN